MATKFLHIKLFFVLIFAAIVVHAQFADTEPPAEWQNLVHGGRFMDRFLQIPVTGSLTSSTWGGSNVIPRYIHNGIEDNDWSYWGGNILKGDDGRYHLYVCRWREDSPKGHMEWPNSVVVHAISDNSTGPYKVDQTIGAGHNPEAFRLKNGNIVIYVIGGYYISEHLSGPWEFKHFEFDNRDRPIIEGLSNLSFVQREDGSFLMVCRGGGIWISKDGISPYHQVTGSSIYPDVEGRFEDPVIWKTGVQYHLIVNDWYGRIAYSLRSKDGVKWVTDPGQAYKPGIAVYEDGTVEDWFKYERIKMLQDEEGRPVQANFAVIDTLKHEDKPRDSHSSKNISIPLVKEKLIEILNKEKINNGSEPVKVKILAEEDFNPHADIDNESLRFGNPDVVDYGGGSRVIKTDREGNNLIIYFDGKGHGISDEDFAAKMLGKTSGGELLFGYARLPEVNYLEALLTARLPVPADDGSFEKLHVVVENFGQVRSEKARLTVEVSLPENKTETLSAKIPEIEPYGMATVEVQLSKRTFPADNVPVTVVLTYADGKQEKISGIIKNPQNADK